MPEIIPLGWFHTAMGAIAIISGAISLFKYRELTYRNTTGLVYLLATLVTAATALAIFQHGSFGPGHALAVLTLAALLTGAVADMTGLFGKAGRYVRAFAYSSTLLFHSIPAITDASLRLPVGDPFLSSIEDPFLRKAYLVLVVLFLVGVTLQLRWIRRQSR
ncbi:MAG: hypothetical protein R3358_04295 [Woeseiaceae bacterium]|nr:hypothetical protein [Woeseiaceae bacterium]